MHKLKITTFNASLKEVVYAAPERKKKIDSEESYKMEEFKEQ